jgi:CubicO group peptidase (beta-lactamase class C family)
MEGNIKSAFDANELPGLHSVVVSLNDELVGEAYFPGADERWGTSLGVVTHGPETLHDVRSITKSVVGLLYGIALSEGLVPEINSPLLNLFPEFTDLRDGSDREKITVRDALTMQMGTKWDESLPYTDPKNSEIAMELAPDRYRYVLNRPMGDVPGTRWNYNGGAVALIGKLIADGTGVPLDEYANDRLFKPLGIKQYEWVRGSDDVPSAASGLRLTARDLAKIGGMIARGGEYEGRQIVTVDWLEKSFASAATIQAGFDYGFLWYLSSGPRGDRVIIALGNGGQRLTVQPKAGFVVSTLTGRYNDPEAWRLSLDVLLKFAIPEVVKQKSK